MKKCLCFPIRKSKLNLRMILSLSLFDLSQDVIFPQWSKHTRYHISRRFDYKTRGLANHRCVQCVQGESFYILPRCKFISAALLDGCLAS